VLLVVFALAVWQLLAPGDPRAPGIAALEKRGCAHASLVDFAAWRDGGAFGPGHPRYALECRAGKVRPTCDDVAATYVRASGPLAADVRVTVHDSSTTICDALYAGDGTPR
jgi:hypothetical protein